MTIKVDRDLTPKYNLEKVYQDGKDFRTRFTANDLRNFFEDTTDLNMYGDIVKCNVSAFSSSTIPECDTQYCVEMIIDGTIDFKRVRFYCENDGTIFNDDMFIDYKVYSN